MKKISLFLFLFILFSPFNLKAADSPLFTDVAPSHPNYEAIKYLKDHYIVHGYSDSSFRPEEKINRAEALKIIILSANYHLDNQALQKIKDQIHSQPKIATENIKINIATSDVDVSTPNNELKIYPDVLEEHWFFPYVMQATSLKIIAGYPDGTFQPANNVNLVESLKMILLSNDAPLPGNIPGDPFLDVKKDVWFAPYVEYFKNYHLLASDDQGNLNPQNFLTRGQLSELIYRFIQREKFKEKYTPNGHEYIYGKATFYGEGDGFDGKNTASGTVFDKNQPIAAHLTLPFGTKIRVYSLENGQSVEVTITDRGPYDDRFILDLSSSSFEKLAPISRGFIDVKFEIIN